MQPFTVHPVVLTPIAPIHIGSGVELDWTQAALQDRELVLFDPLAAELPDGALREIDKALKEKDPGRAMLALQRVFRANAAHLARAGTGRVQLSPGVAAKFGKALGHNVQAGQGGNITDINEIGLARCAIDPATGCPHVPGSSLKGALRTAVVAERHARQHPGVHQQPNPRREDPSDQYLGSFQTSSFSRLMVSDLMPVAGSPGGAYYVRYWKRRANGRVPNNGPLVTVELMRPFQPGACRGEIRVGAGRGRDDPVKALPNLGAILGQTHRFHANLFEAFAAHLDQRIDLMPGWLQQGRALIQALAPAVAEGRAALVRLGKFCSAESKTVAWRSVWNHKVKAHVLEPSTFWLAELGNFHLPLGWAILEIGTDPSAPVSAFCDHFGALLAPEEDADDEDGMVLAPAAAPAPPAAPRIVTDRTGLNRSRLGTLEDQHDADQSTYEMLNNLSKQASTWPAEDRTLLARLYHGKLRARLKPHQQKPIDQRLSKPE